MVERLARAIAVGLGDNFDDAFKSRAEWIEAHGEKGGRFREASEPMQGNYLNAALTVLKAMGEPTLAMDVAGSEMCGVQGSATDPTHVWQAMIDEAIREASGLKKS